MEESSPILAVCKAYVRENASPKNSFTRFSTFILGTWNSWWQYIHDLPTIILFPVGHWWLFHQPDLQWMLADQVIESGDDNVVVKEVQLRELSRTGVGRSSICEVPKNCCGFDGWNRLASRIMYQLISYVSWLLDPMGFLQHLADITGGDFLAHRINYYLYSIAYTYAGNRSYKLTQAYW